MKKNKINKGVDMSIDIKSIKRKLLIKYPTFGSIIANLEFQENREIGTAATNRSDSFLFSRIC